MIPQVFQVPLDGGSRFLPAEMIDHLLLLQAYSRVYLFPNPFLSLISEVHGQVQQAHSWARSCEPGAETTIQLVK